MGLPRIVWAIIWTVLAALVSSAIPHVLIPLWACALFGFGLAYLRSIFLFVIYGDVD